MSDQNQGVLDIAHIVFLDIIETFIKHLGAANAKGMLMRTAINIADSFPIVEFDDLDAFVAAIENTQNPIARVEGRAVYLGDGLFGLPACPFSTSIKDYLKVKKELPPSFDRIPEDFNKPNPVTAKYKIGHGAGVSPFCAIHQPLRSALSQRILIDGKAPTIYQLGCKAKDGTKAIAAKMVEESKQSTDRIEEVLDENMCCYFVKA